jgi:hypothetical protein
MLNKGKASTAPIHLNIVVRLVGEVDEDEQPGRVDDRLIHQAYEARANAAPHERAGDGIDSADGERHPIHPRTAVEEDARRNSHTWFSMARSPRQAPR